MKLSERAIFISFYEEMDILCQRVLHEMNVEIPTFQISKNEKMEDVKERLEARLSEGVSLVICRGLVGAIIREMFPVTVLEVQQSSADILRILLPYQGKATRIGVLESAAFCRQVQEIAELLHLEVSYFPVKNMADFWTNCEKAEKMGVEVLIGGTWGKVYPSAVHIPYIAVEYSEKAVRSCLEDTLQMFDKLFHEEEKKDYLNTLLNYSSEGIISVDHDGKINKANRTAARMLQYSRRELYQKEIQTLFPQYSDCASFLDKTLEHNVVISYGQRQFILSRIPILVENEVTGSVFFINEENKIREADRQLRLSASKKGLVAKRHFESMSFCSPQMQEILNQAMIYSKMSSTILITGETGTGKEFFAQSIHNASLRSTGPFVAVNCGALSSSLLESELFGYAEGAFTGAKKTGKAGIFELAHGGTIFLDEIGEIDAAVQSRLLRVIQEREVMRLGDDKVIPIDVRIIAATNRDLKAEADRGTFRMDLYYRLNVLGIELPPLRKRSGDIYPLAIQLLDEKNHELGCKVTGFDKDTKEFLETYAWPGNIRELSNVVEKMVALTQSGEVRFSKVRSALPYEITQWRKQKKNPAELDTGIQGRTLEEIEKQVILERLEECGGNKTAAAQSLGIGKTTLFRKLSQMQQLDSSEKNQ